MQPPTPPQELTDKFEATDEDYVEVERQETVEVVLFEYEDEENSFTLSVEFLYTFTQRIDQDMVLA